MRGVAFVLLLAVPWAASAQPAARPKYAPHVVRLYDAREYVRTHDAPDYWALVGYYEPQRDDLSCSLAAAAMSINALRAPRTLHANDELATQAGLLERTKDDRWRKSVSAGGAGVSLTELARLLPLAARAYGLEGTSVQKVHVPAASAEALAALRAALRSNESEARDLILVNFLQSELTGDPEGAVGHIAPIGAYDAQAQRVLIFDPDRRWYEPYWVPDTVLLKAIATRDNDAAAFRGYLRIQRGK